MRGLINILKSRYFLLSVGMAMLVGLIFFLGRLMSWPFQWQLLGVIGVLVLFIVVLAISFARANKSASMIEQSIKQQGQQQLMNTRPDKRPEIEAMQEKLERAIQQLKTSKLGRGKRGKAALYALPWYMFIGPPAAGKTTTIANSGLNFPLGTDGVRGVGGTRDCDWFFTDSAILLDTAGRYTTEFQDNEEWVAFLETLKKHRKDQPINGVIIGISIADLISASPMEVEQHADTIRRRIDELIKHLGVRFPVYLTFTKCDLLQGFTEFFGDMQRGEREQVWGATLDKEQQADRNVRAVFETEFGRLHDALLNMRTSRLSRSLKREARRKVYTFPLQFGAVKDTLAQFVGQVFLPNPYQESPIFRGFYFTSGTQEGVPLDTVIQNIASQFNLSVLPESGGEPVVETKSYFIRQFFEEVVIPDQFLVERTSRAATQGRVLQLATLVGSLAILALFALGAFTSLFRGLDQLEEVAAASDVVQQARLDNPMALSANIANLDTLRQELYQLENPPLLSLGLYPSSEVEEAASEVYQSKLRALVAEQVERLERRMRQAAARGGNLEESARDTLFQDLKAYLLLTEEADRLSDRDNQNYLEQKLTELLTEQLRRGTEGDAPAQQATSFVEALQVRLENPELTWQAPFPGDDRLIGTARGAIGSLNPSVIYGQVIRDVKNELGLRDVTLDVILSGRPGRNLFTQSSARVDGVFQAAFWPDVRKAIRDRSSNPYGDDWVLGRENQEAQTNLLSEDEIVEDMEQRYFNDFVGQWSRFLNSIRLDRSQFNTIQAAERSMFTLSSGTDSPLLYILGTVANETLPDNFSDPLDQLEQEAGSALANEAGRRARALSGGRNIRTPGARTGQDGTPPMSAFSWLHDAGFQTAITQPTPRVQALFDALVTVHSAVDEARDPGIAMETAATLVGNGGDLGGAFETIQRQGQLDRTVRQNLFEAPAEWAGSSVISAAQQALNERWRSDVQEPFQQLLGSQFPFDRSSSQDANPSDIADFFDSSNGPVAVFLESLKPFVQGGNLDQMRPQTWQRRGISFSSSTQRAIQRADQIGRVMLSGGGIAELTFELRPDQTIPNGSPTPGEVLISVHGTTETYGQGTPRWLSFQWRGTEDLASLEVRGREQRLADIEYEGGWAFFRMLRAAQISSGGGNNYRVLWRLSGPNNSYSLTQPFDLRSRGSVAPFVDAEFFNFNPPSRLN